MSRQIQEYRENGEEIYWIDNAFGGMPTYQLGARYPYDFLTPIHKIFQLIPQPSEILFLYLLTAYIFLLIIKMPIPIAILGAFAYGLSTYLLIIIQVGHNTKSQALAYMPLVIGGMYLLLSNKRLLGFLLTVFALSMQIRANHYQMTYYMLLLMLVIYLFYGIEAIKEKSVKSFFKNSILLIISAILSLGQMDPSKLPKNFDQWTYWSSWTISLMVTASNGFLQLFSLYKNYFEYALTTEQLKTEGWQYFQLSVKY